MELGTTNISITDVNETIREYVYDAGGNMGAFTANCFYSTGEVTAYS